MDRPVLVPSVPCFSVACAYPQYSEGTVTGLILYLMYLVSVYLVHILTSCTMDRPDLVPSVPSFSALCISSLHSVHHGQARDVLHIRRKSIQNICKFVDLEYVMYKNLRCGFL